MSALSQTILVIHIGCGFLALGTGFFSMINRKGSKNHKLTGKIFFGGMTGIFISATILSVIRPNPFLFMVAFFSYYLACSGYRALYLKANAKLKAAWLDWVIGSIGFAFGLGLIVFSFHWFQMRGFWGFVPLTFGSLCVVTAFRDLINFYRPPQNNQWRLISHGSKMGGAFASTVTAFIVTNFTMGTYTWVLWILPGILIGTWINRKLQIFKIAADKSNNLNMIKKEAQ